MLKRKEREERRRVEEEARKLLHAERQLNVIDADQSFNADDENSVNSSNDLRVKIRELSTGAILPQEEMPKISELDGWLETHPGYV